MSCHVPTAGESSAQRLGRSLVELGGKNGIIVMDDADLGLWCGPKTVNLKRGPETVGTYSYDDVLEALLRELDAILAAR